MANQRAAVRMDAAEVAAMLAEPGLTMTIATLLADGHPHLAAIWYGFTADGTLGFTTYAKSQKAVNLRRDPRLTALVETGTQYSVLRGVQIAGRGVVSSSTALKLELSRSVRSRYPTTVRWRDPQRSMARRVAILIQPEHVISWDHRKLRARP